MIQYNHVIDDLEISKKEKSYIRSEINKRALLLFINSSQQLKTKEFEQKNS